MKPTEVARQILRNLLLTVPLMVAFALMTSGAQASPRPAAERAAQVNAWSRAYVREQVQALGCNDQRRLSPRVAIVPAATTPAERAQGLYTFDLTVVTVVPFDAAFAQAKAGKVWVVGWCG